MNKSDLQRVLSALNIRVSGENTKSKYLNASCPFAPWLHKGGHDHSASFGVHYDDRDRSFFTCLACKQKGSLAKLVQRLGQLRMADYQTLLNDVRAVEQGAISTHAFEPFDRPFEEDQAEITPLNEALYDGLYPPAWEVPEARAYLQSRGITPETAENLGLLYKDVYRVERQDGSIGEWFRGDILFPVRDRDGNLYGWSGRTTRDVKPKVYDPDLPKRHLILGEERWQEGRPTVIVEGLFAYAWLVNIGVEEFANVGAIMGSVFTPEKAAILKSWGNPVVCMLDNDQAGDVGLFGAMDENGVRDEGQAMVPMLLDALVVVVPGWPNRVNGTPKEDPDELTYDEVRAMVFETTPTAPPKKNPRTFSVDKHSNTR